MEQLPPVTHPRWWEDAALVATLPPRDEDHWILLVTGKAWWPWNPRPGECDIYDVACGMANESRWAGQTNPSYKDAQHCVAVSNMVAPQYALRGLLHDAAEGLGFRDLPSRIKRVPGMETYRAGEKRCQAVVYATFGLGPTDPPEIKRADMAMLRQERRVLHAGTPKPMGLRAPDIGGEDPEMDARAQHQLRPLHWAPVWNEADARAEFLLRFTEIQASGVPQE